MNSKQLAQYELTKKSVGVAYILGFVLGLLGVHCFYAKQPEHGLFRLVLFFLGVVFTPLIIVSYIIFIADFVLTKGWVDEYNQKVLAMVQDE